jgi:hypothetical protein
VHDAITGDRERVVHQAGPSEPGVSANNGSRKAARRAGARS